MTKAVGMALAFAVALPLAMTSSPAPSRTAVAEFHFAYPREVRAIPALRAWVDRENAQSRAGVLGQAAADRRDATAQGRPFIPYASDRTWKVVANTPRLLSLSVERYDFTGGAHGMTSWGSIVWDRQATGPRPTFSFFTSPRALAAAVRPAFCRGLDAQRRRKRGGTGRIGGEFDACVDPAEQALILGSASRTRFDRIGFLIAPYEAGPYAEGGYEVTLPVTPAVLAAVRPEWRRYFAIGTP